MRIEQATVEGRFQTGSARAERVRAWSRRPEECHQRCGRHADQLVRGAALCWECADAIDRQEIANRVELASLRGR